MTTLGKVHLEAVHGQDPQTEQWFCPVRHSWNLAPHQTLSPVLEEKLCFTATFVGSYEAAARVAQKWGVPADDSTIHAHVQQVGKRAEALREARVERALDPATRGEVVAESARHLKGREFSLVIEMDGWMVRERGGAWGLKPPEKQGDRVAWHEMKTAIVFRLDHRIENGSGRPEILEKFYVAWRGEPYEFGRRLYAEALRRGLNQAQKVYVVADGAAWIWNVAADRFPGATEVLDFYHASQHLWAVAEELFGADRCRAERWVKPLLHMLKHGDEKKVRRRLNDRLKRSLGRSEPAPALERETKYFGNHQGRIHYAVAAGEGCPIGSGAMESTCSQLQDRFKRTGQFWSPPGEKCLLALNLARRNHDWDELWASPYQQN